MRIVLLFLLCSATFFLNIHTASGQTTFTEHVKRQKNGEGKVIIVQKKAIEDAVNGLKPETAKPAEGNKKKAHTENNGDKNNNADKEEREHSDKNNTSHYTGARGRHKAMGYRIQIYTGGNSHKDKTEAYEIGRKCQAAFPMLSSYPRFINPRWTCRVGDFKNHEEAAQFAEKIRSARITKEIRIVKCEVNATW